MRRIIQTGGSGAQRSILSQPISRSLSLTRRPRTEGGKEPPPKFRRIPRISSPLHRLCSRVHLRRTLGFSLFFPPSVLLDRKNL